MSDYQYEVTSMPVDETLFYRRADAVQRLRFLIRYAQLAASTYNSQPWQFSIQSSRQIWVYADHKRWLKIADADKREMHISLGCAIENLLTAAEHYNFKYEIDYVPDRLQLNLMAVVHLKPGKGEPGLIDAALIQAITQRRTVRKDFLRDPLEAGHWALLESCSAEGVNVISTRQSSRLRQKIAELTPLAYEVLYNDRAYRSERQDRLALSNTRIKGLLIKFMCASRKLFGKVDKRFSIRDQRWIEQAPGLLVLGVSEDSTVMRLKVGRAYQRLSLMATTLGIGVQPLSQILEIPELRAELKNALGHKQFEPMMICRLGYHGPQSSRKSLRRKLVDVLV